MIDLFSKRHGCILNRRGFISRLAVAPFVSLGLKLEKMAPVYKNLRFPIDCDLSFMAIRYAIQFLEENGCGKPKLLVVPVEMKWIARKLLEGECDCGGHSRNIDRPIKVYTACSELNALGDFYQLKFGVDYWSPSQSAWCLFAEKGSVLSIGP